MHYLFSFLANVVREEAPCLRLEGMFLVFCLPKVVAGFDNHHSGDQCRYGVGGGLLFTWQMRLASLYPRSMCDPSSFYMLQNNTLYIYGITS